VTKAKDGHEDYRKHTYVLRSFLHCCLGDLLMHGNVRKGRKGAYYTCELNRRHSSLVPGAIRARSFYARTRRAQALPEAEMAGVKNARSEQGVCRSDLVRPPNSTLGGLLISNAL
jgi:hypothetical protein